MKKTRLKTRTTAAVLTVLTVCSVATAAVTTANAATDRNDFATDLSKSAIETGVKKMFGEVPIVGEIFSGPVSGLIENALGLSSMSVEDVSAQVDDLREHLDIKFDDLDQHLDDIDKKLIDLQDETKIAEKKLELKIDDSTKKLVDSMYNAQAVSAYRNSMQTLADDFSVVKTKLASLNDTRDDGTPVYNDDEKIVKLADAVGSEKTWSDYAHPIKNLIDVGGCLTGSTYLGTKSFYHTIYDPILDDPQGNRILFAKDAVERTNLMMSDVMRTYLSYYSLMMESLRAQQIIVAHDNGITIEGEAATINPDNLSSRYARSTYDEIACSDYNDIVNMENKLTETFRNVLDQWENGIDSRTFIDYGKENRILDIRECDQMTAGYHADGFFKQNYTVTQDQLAEICDAAKAKGMSLRQYLNDVGYTNIPCKDTVFFQEKLYVFVGMDSYYDKHFRSYYDIIDPDKTPCQSERLVAEFYDSSHHLYYAPYNYLVF